MAGNSRKRYAMNIEIIAQCVLKEKNYNGDDKALRLSIALIIWL